MKVFKFNGKKYAWNYKESPLYIAGCIMITVAGALSLWALTCGVAACEVFL